MAKKSRGRSCPRPFNYRRTKSHVQLDRANPKSTEEMIIKEIIIIFSVQHKLYHMLTGIAKVKVDLI